LSRAQRQNPHLYVLHHRHEAAPAPAAGLEKPAATTLQRPLATSEQDGRRSAQSRASPSASRVRRATERPRCSLRYGPQSAQRSSGEEYVCCSAFVRSRPLSPRVSIISFPSCFLLFTPKFRSLLANLATPQPARRYQACPLQILPPGRMPGRSCLPFPTFHRCRCRFCAVQILYKGGEFFGFFFPLGVVLPGWLVANVYLTNFDFVGKLQIRSKVCSCPHLARRTACE
jgi:hypothetical protein